MVSRKQKNYSWTFINILHFPAINPEDLQTLVTSDDLLTNNVHNNGGDNLLLIENGEITAMNDNKKSNIFTWREVCLFEITKNNQIQLCLATYSTVSAENEIFQPVNQHKTIIKLIASIMFRWKIPLVQS